MISLDVKVTCKTCTIMMEVYVTLTAWLSFGICNSRTELKRIQNSQSDKKSLQLVGKVADFNFQSAFQPQPFIWPLAPKAISEDNPRAWVPNLKSRDKLLKLLGHCKAQLWLERAKTGWFQVTGSLCRLLQARFTKAVNVSTLCKFWAVTWICFFHEKEISINLLEHIAGWSQSRAHPMAPSFIQAIH